MRRIGGFWLAVVTLVGCGGGDGDDHAAVDAAPETRDVPEGCHPLGDVHCGLPFPSMHWLTEDEDTATGYRVALGEATLPMNAAGSRPDAADFAWRDGFSAAGPILVAFGVPVDAATLPGPDSIERSLAADSPTIIVDGSTGERVPHFAELDASSADDARRALILRPAVRLAGGRRYAVAVTDRLRARDGAALPRPVRFDPAELAGTVGVPADELVVAWEFVTASDAVIERDLVTARDLAFAALVPRVVIDRDVVVDDGTTWRRLEGSFDVPWFLDDGDRLARDDRGAPLVLRTAPARLVVNIPACARTQGRVPIVVFGHGIFGDPSEVGSVYTAKPAQYLCVVTVATSWIGMTQTDIAQASTVLGDIRHARVLGEKLVQGVVNTLVLAHIAAGALADLPALHGVVDRGRVHFYGISLGGILGATVLALSPDLERGVLGVPAANFSLIIERSSAWPFFDLINQGAYADPIDQQLTVAHLQLQWDLTDPATFGPRLAGRSLLVQVADGDSVVNNLGAYFLARVADLPQLAPTDRGIWGTKSAGGPLTRAFVIYDEDVDPPLPAGNLPGAEIRGTHETMRGLRSANDQIHHFLETGDILSFCRDTAGAVAPCDCAAGHCGPPL